MKGKVVVRMLKYPCILVMYHHLPSDATSIITRLINNVPHIGDFIGPQVKYVMDPATNELIWVEVQYGWPL